MTARHADDTLPRNYQIEPPEVWAAIRAQWEAGSSGALLARRFGVNPVTIASRKRRERWTRATPLQRLTAPPPVEISALGIAECALSRSVEALADGRASDAMALIKAGDAVGAFADFVAGLRGAASRPANSLAAADAAAQPEDGAP